MNRPMSKNHYMIGVIIGVSFVSGFMLCLLQNESKIFSSILQLKFKENPTPRSAEENPIKTIKQVYYSSMGLFR